MSRIGSPPTPRPPQPDSPFADFLSDEQKQALATGDIAAQQQADDAALAMAIQASLDDMAKVNNTVKPETRSIPQEELQAQRKINDKLRDWFTDRDMTVVANQGKNQNCLLISLLQHASGNYQSQHEDAAIHYKDLLTRESQGRIKKYDALYDDTTLMTTLIHRLNEQYLSDMRVDFYTADLDGNPAIRSVGNGKKPVIIFNQVGHFEAVVSRAQLQPPK
jgi:hypothetical protein